MKEEIQLENIQLSENEITRILHAIPDIYYRTDLDGKIMFISSSVEQIFGYKPHEVIGKPMTDFYINPEDRNLFLESLHQNSGRVSGFESRMRHKHGNPIWVSTSAWYITKKGKKIFGVEGVTRGITQRKQLEEELRDASESYKKLYEEHLNILEYSPGGILKIDQDMKITYMNPAMMEILGVPQGQNAVTIGANIMDLQTVQKAGFIPILEKVAAMEKVSTEGLFHSLYGKSTYISVQAVPFMKDNKFSGGVFLITDITKLKEMSESLKYQATHDPLTGLINRREFEKKLYEAMEISNTENTEHALCYLDLDQFKIVNDTCGHMAGDDLLRQLSPLIEEVVGEGNLLARLGGDEFGVIYYNKNIDDGAAMAEKLLSVVRDFRFLRNNKMFEIGASIGVVSITPGCMSISELLSAADSACYLAKENGRNRLQVYESQDDAMQIQKNHMQWFQKLTHAIEKDRFIIYFQPINMINLSLSHDVVGEFLVRMVGDDGQIIMPSVFIPSAERYQLMHKIDRFVVDSVFSLLALKPKKNQEGKPEKIYTVNLSAQSLSTPGFFEFIREAFDKYEIPPKSICFEITETAVISNIAEAIKFIRKLKELGCFFALDDFGSGMSSLAHLKRLPVDFVKIDGGFILSMRQNEADMVMIKSVVEISRVMNLRTIAEYVEDSEAAETLKSMGVDYTQGYFHGHPQDAKLIEI